MKTEYLIIGNSVAGVGAIEAIRECGSKGSITVVSDEKGPTYSRPLISYYLGGRLGRDALQFRPQDFLARHRATLVAGTRAVRLEPEKSVVTLDDGKTITYDKLLLATGGRPAIPPIAGYDPAMRGVFTFTRLADADAILSWMAERNITGVVVVGAGLIGLKATEGFLARGIRVRLVEMADRILPTTLDKEASNILESRLAAGGCEIHKRDSLERIIGNGEVKGVVLRNGRQLPASLLVLAAGVRPDTSLVAGTGVVSDRGIIVDARQATSVPGIYAAGDCAQGLDFITGGRSVIAIWPVAARQGKIAGLNMAGREAIYPGLFPMNAVQVMDIPTVSFGLTNPAEGDHVEVLRRVDLENLVYRKIIIRENRVVGAILLGTIDRAGIYGLLIREKVDVSHFKEELLGDDFGFLSLPKEFRAHMVTGEGMEV